MSVSDVKQILSQANLYFNSDTINEVYSFLVQCGYTSEKQHLRCQVLAATAILLQIKSIQLKRNQQLSQFHINIQTVMSYANNISKQQFLQVIQQMISKDKKMSIFLSQKVKKLQISYRFFKNYRKAFQDLWEHCAINKLVMNDILSIFWIVFLLVKNQHYDKLYMKDNEQKLIITLLKCIFQYWIAKVDDQVINFVINDNFNNLEIKEQYFLIHHLKFKDTINLIYSKKFQNKQIVFQKFIKNAIQIAKFLDAISKYYFTQNIKFDCDIDEISYLSLSKGQYVKSSRTRESCIQSNQSISNLMVSPSPNQMLYQNLIQLTPIRRAPNTNPNKNRIVNLQWVRKCIDHINNEQSQQILHKLFKSNLKSITYQQYQIKAKNKLMLLVQKFTPKCIRKDNRVHQLYAFFKFFILKVFKTYTNFQNQKMFAEINVFNSMLCITADVFNFVYSSFASSYRQECQLFQIPLLQAIKPLNWIGREVVMPKDIFDYLYAMQKRIFIKQIWQDQTGYNLIRSQLSYNQSFSIAYPDMIFLNRLKKHIFDRVQELCKQILLIDHSFIRRVQQVIQKIVSDKPFLLFKNKIDQIVICSITLFLTINQIHQKQTLQKVFNDYNKIDLSFQNNKTGLMGDNRQMTLLQFYNEKFLPQVQQIVKNSNFITTPIRKNHQYVLNTKTSMTPFVQKYKQSTNETANFLLQKSNITIGFKNLSKIMLQDTKGSPGLNIKNQNSIYRKTLCITKSKSLQINKQFCQTAKIQDIQTALQRDPPQI